MLEPWIEQCGGLQQVLRCRFWFPSSLRVYTRVNVADSFSFFPVGGGTTGVDSQIFPKRVDPKRQHRDWFAILVNAPRHKVTLRRTQMRTCTNMANGNGHIPTLSHIERQECVPPVSIEISDIFCNEWWDFGSTRAPRDSAKRCLSLSSPLSGKQECDHGQHRSVCSIAHTRQEWATFRHRRLHLHGVSSSRTC